MKRSPLIILFVTIFIDLLGFGLILPLLPNYIQHYGGRPWVGGALLSCYSVTQFIFAPIWGRLSDRKGRRPMILLSLIGSAISFFFFGWAPNLIVLFLARISAGILSSASLPTAQAYIADVTPPNKRAGGMALIGAAFGLGFALGPVFSGILSQHPIFGITALAMPAYAAALLSIVNFVAAVFFLPETHRDRSDEAPGEQKRILDVFPAIITALKSPAFGAPLTVFAFATFAFTAVESSFSWLVLLRFKDAIYADAVVHWNAGHPAQLFAALPAALQRDLIEKSQASATTSVFTVVGVTILITQVAVMRGLARRIGENRLVMFGSLTLTAALIAIAFAPGLTFLRICSVFIAIGNGVLNPCLTSLITQSAGPNNRGAISGVQQGLGSLARIIAPPINNILVGAPAAGLLLTGAIPFLCSSALMSAAFFLSLKLHPMADVGPSPTASTPSAPEEAPAVEASAAEIVGDAR